MTISPVPHELADVLGLGKVGAEDAAFLDGLLQVAKAPLGWHGEFCARFFLDCDDPLSLPMGVIMCADNNFSSGDWRRDLKSGTIVVASKGSVTTDLVKEVLLAGGIFLVAADAAQSLDPALKQVVLSFQNSTELVTFVTTLLKDQGKLQELSKQSKIASGKI